MLFAKWHGLGNDYLLIERAGDAGPLEASLVERLCDSHWGIGGDGVLEIVATTARGPRS